MDRIAPHAGLPDMVFTANAGLALGKKFVLSRFLPRERQGEEPVFKKWFKKQGFDILELPADLPFEGAGDALLDPARGCLWAGYGFRSELAAHPRLAEWLNIEVISLRLIDPRFYHLDTCFCPLENGAVLYYPAGLRRLLQPHDRATRAGRKTHRRQRDRRRPLRLQRRQSRPQDHCQSGQRGPAPAPRGGWI